MSDRREGVCVCQLAFSYVTPCFALGGGNRGKIGSFWRLRNRFQLVQFVIIGLYVQPKNPPSRPSISPSGEHPDQYFIGSTLGSASYLSLVITLAATASDLSIPNYYVAQVYHWVPFWTSSLNTTNIGLVERGLVVMGCVVDVRYRLLASIRRGHPERALGRLLFYCFIL